MRRSLILLALVAACGGTALPTTTVGADAPDTTGAPGTSVPAETSTTGETPETDDGATTTTDSGRPVAPPFTLQLGDGGTYTLTEGSKPVYMVFWAEW